MATPHVAGTVALIWSASASLKGDVAGTRALLNTTATDTDSTGCGGTVANNNNFGEGRLNAFRAVSNAPRGPTGTLTGRVTDSLSGEALAGATVVATGPASASATTNASGVYSIVVPAGTYSVTASLTLYQSGTVTGVVVPANGTATANLVLRPNFGTLTGRITNSVTGAGVPGASITVFGAGGTFRTTSDAAGNYTITRLPAGSYAMHVTASGFFLGSARPTIVAAAVTVQNVAIRPTR